MEDQFNFSLEASEIQARLAAVPGKVNTSAIVNNLTSGGATVPLSAEQGKTLKDLVDDNSASISELSTKINEKTSYGVVGTNDLLVAAQSTPNMTVKVAAGTIYMANGGRFTPTANTALAINTADATNPRIDIVYVNSSGVISYLAGTAAASPTAPSVPTGGQKLAEITVATGATTITSAAIADRRKTLIGEAFISLTLMNGWTGSLKIAKSSSGFVTVLADLVAGASTYTTNIASFPSGYAPLQNAGALLRDETSSGTLSVQFVLSTARSLTLLAGAASGRSIKGSFVYFAG